MTSHSTIVALGAVLPLPILQPMTWSKAAISATAVVMTPIGS
ncbi:hypothetical protein [Rhodococcus sp. MS16]|nr:hypothetical protein [Rhodococcus sp. MS16]